VPSKAAHTIRPSASAPFTHEVSKRSRPRCGVVAQAPHLRLAERRHQERRDPTERDPASRSEDVMLLDDQRRPPRVATASSGRVRELHVVLSAPAVPNRPGGAEG
jgi:hypothetical protein